MKSRLLFFLLLISVASAVPAQQKTVRVLVGLAPGGTVELVSRLYAEKLRAALGVPVVIENRVGASGLIAMEALRNSAPDGSTLLFAPNGGVTLVPQTNRNARFDPFKDLLPVAQVAIGDFVFAVNSGVGARTLAEYIGLAKQDAKYRNLGSALGTIPHLLSVLFANAAGFELSQITYKGGGQVSIDILGGQLQASFVTPGEAVPHQRSGKMRLLAQSGARRSALLPNIPTLRESGIAIDMSSWFGFYAPAGTPAAVIEQIGRPLVEAARSTEVRERLAQVGIEAAGRPADEVARQMRADYEMWARAIKLAGLKPE